MHRRKALYTKAYGFDICSACVVLLVHLERCSASRFQDRLQALSQAEENAGDYDPIVIFKRNRSETYAIITVKTFIELIDENSKSSK